MSMPCLRIANYHNTIKIITFIKLPVVFTIIHDTVKRMIQFIKLTHVIGGVGKLWSTTNIPRYAYHLCCTCIYIFVQLWFNM